MDKKIEKAIHIPRLNKLGYWQKGRHQRIYWGSEFCQNLIPCVEDTKKMMGFAKRRDLGLTFLTPFVTDAGLTRLKEIFELIRGSDEAYEVVVNDWGVLMMLCDDYPDLKLSLGRLLTRQNCDVQMEPLRARHETRAYMGPDGKVTVLTHYPMDRAFHDSMRKSFVNVGFVGDLLSRYNIGRVELNNLVQGADFTGIRQKVSLYTPYVNVSTTRFCPMETDYQRRHRINVCTRECQKHYLRLYDKQAKKTLYRRGNTLFYRNRLALESIDSAAVDRIVFQKELPS